MKFFRKDTSKRLFAELSKEQKQTFLKLWDKKIKTLPKFEAMIGHRFKDRFLLLEALTHSSATRGNLKKEFFIGDSEPELPWNERMEFLGDAVLGLTISTVLMNRPEKFPEGELSKIRSYLVNEKMLSTIAGELTIGDFMLLGRGEERDDGRYKTSILADALEAVIGAVYLDAGFDVAEKVIKRIFGDLLEGELSGYSEEDFKSMLQEFSQERYGLAPRYEVVLTQGPAHCRTFDVVVIVAGKRLGTGRGTTKKKASQEAARIAYQKLTEKADHD